MDKNHASLFSLIFGERVEGKRRIIKSIKARADAKRTAAEKVADWLTSRFGSMAFLILNFIWFASWVLINTGNIKSITPFDPFPFSLLTTVVSLEAIFLAIIVLISQNRNSKVDDLREEIHLQVNLIAEKEITKIIKMMAVLLEKQGVDLSQDPEIKKWSRPVSEEDIENRLEKEIL